MVESKKGSWKKRNRGIFVFLGILAVLAIAITAEIISYSKTTNEVFDACRKLISEEINIYNVPESFGNNKKEEPNYLNNYLDTKKEVFKDYFCTKTIATQEAMLNAYWIPVCQGFENTYLSKGTVKEFKFKVNTLVSSIILNANDTEAYARLCVDVTLTLQAGAQQNYTTYVEYTLVKDGDKWCFCNAQPIMADGIFDSKPLPSALPVVDPGFDF